MSNYIAAIDQGTTSSRVIIFDMMGNIIDSAQKELQQHYPKDGWVEHDPMDIWDDTLFCLKTMTSKYKNVKAIGITNQRETTIIWDKSTGKPIYNGIVWQDRRTSETCASLKGKGFEKDVQEKTGLLLDPYFSATKVKWILDQYDGDQTNLAFGTVESWLLWNLTGGKVHASDVTNASRTMLYNIEQGVWDMDLLDMFGLNEDILPDIHPNVYEYGEVDKDIVGYSIPIMGMIGDQQAATLGQACTKPGMIKSTYGTGCFVLLNTGEERKKSQNRLLGTVSYEIGGQKHYALEGSIFNAGTAIQWLRDGLGIIDHAKETENMAKAVDDNGGVYYIPAFTGLGAPYWNANARGQITGLKRNSSKEHIVRAALEAQAYQTKDLLDTMEKDTGISAKTLRVDGGMVANNFVCQTLADILQIQVDRPKIIETTALGAAYSAMLGLGEINTLDKLSDKWQLDKSFYPKITSEQANEMYEGWQSSIQKIV